MDFSLQTLLAPSQALASISHTGKELRVQSEARHAKAFPDPPMSGRRPHQTSSADMSHQAQRESAVHVFNLHS